MNHYAQNNALDSFKQSYVKLPIHLQIKPSHGAYGALAHDIRFKHYYREGLSGMLAGVVIFLPALCVILYNSY